MESQQRKQEDVSKEVQDELEESASVPLIEKKQRKAIKQKQN